MITAKIAGKFDNTVIDGVVDGLAESIRGVGRKLRGVQSGQMQENLTVAFAFAAVLIVAFVFYINR
jgi:multicomponent Na+:H+ antiporter subunit D